MPSATATSTFPDSTNHVLCSGTVALFVFAIPSAIAAAAAGSAFVGSVPGPGSGAALARRRRAGGRAG